MTLDPTIFAENTPKNTPQILADGTIVPTEIDKNMNITMKRTCENLRLDVILNFQWYHKKQFNNLPEEIKTNSYKCLKWNFVKLYHIHLNSTADNLALMKQYCKTQLHLVLNKGGQGDLRDYVAHFCGKHLIHNQNMFKHISGMDLDKKILAQT